MTFKYILQSRPLLVTDYSCLVPGCLKGTVIPTCPEESQLL